MAAKCRRCCDTSQEFLQSASSYLVEVKEAGVFAAESLRELAENQDVYGLFENSSNLSNRSILLIGGWEDVSITIDYSLLPFYRALKATGANDVTFTVCHADHGFGSVRDQLIKELGRWIFQ